MLVPRVSFIMEKHYKISEAAAHLGVCTKTIRRWDARGKITCNRTVGGHRRISILEISRLIEDKEKDLVIDPEKMVAVYCRVSSHDQKKKGDLERQVKGARAYCTAHGFKNIKTFTDVGSGLNTRRSGLKKMCTLIEGKKITRVILTYPDRLTRFGFSYLENYFKSHGASIHAINEKVTTSMQEELVQDLIAIVTSFSGRVHGMRSHKNKKKNKNDNS